MKLKTTINLFILFCCFTPKIFAQSCPNLPGSWSQPNLVPNYNGNFFPGNLPPSAPPGSYGHSTISHVLFHDKNYSESQKSVVTIHSTLDGTTYGKLQVLVPALEFKPGTVLNIYQGTSPSGTLLETITYDNHASKRGTFIATNDAVTVEFYGDTEGTDSYSNYVQILTGDYEIPTCNTTRSTTLIWRDYITPNSYLAIDDQLSAINPGDLIHSLPACIAYFDNNKNFINVERSYCLDKPLEAPTTYYAYYPGEISLQLVPAGEYFDIDGANGHDAADKLKIARILWIIQKGNEPGFSDFEDAQWSVWETQSSGVSDGLNYSLSQQAQAAITSIPDPAEPDFSISGSAGTSTQVNNLINITIPRPTWSGGTPGPTTDLDLIIPSGLTISNLTGATFDGSILSFTDTEAKFDVTSPTPGTFEIKVAYNQPNYFNIKNLHIYEPCDSGFQRFLHIGEENLPIPFRNLSVEFTPAATPVKLSQFTAVADGQVANLNWATTEEINFSHFEVLKSYDLNTWTSIGTVAASTTGNYSFVDTGLKAGKTTYYRLKMIDADETFEYSSIRSVNVEGGSKILSVYPNPTSEIIYLNYSNLEQLANLQIYDERGNLRVSKSGGELLHGISLKGLSKGLHFVKVKSKDGETYTEKILIQN